MIPNITIMLSLLMLVGAKMDLVGCTSDYPINNKPPKAREWCHYVHILPRVGYQAWYQGGAFLRVIDGNLTVESEANDPHQPIISLDIEGRGVNKLMKGFARISSLKWLSLEDNALEKIDEASIFESLPELTYLNLARNRITYLHKDTFRGLNKLEVLNLNDNGLGKELNFMVGRNTLPALKDLYLQHNLLEEIFDVENHMSNLCDSDLQHLYLSTNSIKIFTMPDQVCQDNYDCDLQNSCLQHMTHLFLEDNLLSEIKISKSLPLVALSLDGNNMHEIPADIPSGIKFLSLARNDIAIIRDMQDLKNIEYLMLSYNLITEISSIENLQNLSSLKHLALDYKFVESMPSGFFQKLTSLQSLYLINTKMTKISPQAFENSPKLREILILTN